MATQKAAGKLVQVREFPVGEYQARLRRARALMRKAGLDALLVTTETNHRYFTGHWTHRWYNWSRPIISILPLKGCPVVIASSVEIGMARMTAWARNFKEYLAHDHTIDPVIRAIHEGLSGLGVGAGRIGCELGEAQRMGLPVAEFQRLQKGLPKARFVDAAALLWSLRMVKSPREVKRLRESVAITNATYRSLPQWFRRGMTEADVYRAFVARLFQRGADKEGYVIVNSHLGNAYPGGPTHRAIRAGNTFYIDAGCIRQGYWSDYCRYFGVVRWRPSTRMG